MRVLLATEEVHYDFFSLNTLQVVQVSRRMLPSHPNPDDAKAFPAVITAHTSSSVQEVIERLAATRKRDRGVKRDITLDYLFLRVNKRE